MNHLDPLEEKRLRVKVTLLRLLVGCIFGCIAGVLCVFQNYAILLTIGVGVLGYLVSVLLASKIMKGYRLKDRATTGLISYVFAYLVFMAVGYSLVL